ncbi:MAG TPA: hypothetical protein VIC26_14470, partial [Marinagarivorans sp.]
MIFSARTLAVALACTALLSGCFNKSEKQEWQVEPEGVQSQFPVPQKVQQKVELEYLSAQVRVDNNDWEPLTIDGNTATGSVKGIAEGNRTISVRFVYNSPLYGELVLAQVSKDINIIAGASTRLEILESDYDLDLFDDDRDGINNADEIDQGTSPIDANDPPPVSSVPSSAFSSSSSSSLNSSSSAPSSQPPSSVASIPSSSSVASISSSSSSDSSSSDNNQQLPFNAVADAGPNIANIEEGSIVEITGAAIDPNGPVSYSWRYVGTESLTLSGTDTDTLVFQTGNYLQSTLFEFELTVTVGDVVSAPDSVVVSVIADDDAPVVSFLPVERTVAPATEVSITPFEHKDPEGQPLTYSWAQSELNTVILEDFSFDNETATFTTPELTSAEQTLELTFELTVSDGVNATTESVKVIVQGDNEAPVARITAADDATTLAENTTLVLSGATSSDDYTDAADLAYQWTLETDVPFELGIEDWTAQDITVVAPNLAADYDLQFSLVVTDDSTPALSSSKVVYDLTITAQNDPAIVTLNAPTAALPGGAVELSATVTDPDFEHADLTYTFAWSEPAGFEGLLSNTDEASTGFTAPSDLLEAAVLEFGLQVTQVGEGSLPIAAITVPISVGEGYVPPTAVAALAMPAAAVRETVAFDLSAAGSSAGSHAIVSYSWTTNDCTDGSLENADTALATFTPANRVATYTCTFNLTVADAQVPTGVTESLEVSVNATNEPPTLIADSPIIASSGDVVTLDASESSDPEGQALIYSWTADDASVTLTGEDSATASFTVPAVAVATEFTFAISISDGAHIRSADVVVQVEGSNSAPTAVITPLADDSAPEASTVVLDGSASNDDFTASADLQYQWSLLTDIAYDLGITDLTGPSLTFTAPDLAQPLDLTFQLVVTDEQGEASAAATYTLTIAASNNAPVVTATATPAMVNANALVTLRAEVSNSDLDQADIAYTYTWSAPAGYESLLGADATSSVVSFNAPNVADATQLNFTVVATEEGANGLSSAEASVAVTVSAGYFPPVPIAEIVGGGDVLEEGVAAQLTAEGSIAGTFAITDYLWATDCTGLLTNETAEIAAFLPDNLLAAESCSFTLTVSDGETGGEQQVVLPVTVSASNEQPVVSFMPARITATPNTEITLTPFEHRDPEAQPLSYSWSQSMLNPVVIDDFSADNETATFTTPSLSSASETLELTFELTVSD